MEQKKECAREGNTNAQNAVKGKEYQNPLTIVYHGKNDVSSTEKKKVHFYYGMGIKELNCAYCGKNFIPTRPEYACGNCCSYHCFIHRNDERQNTRIKMYERNGRYIKTFETIEEAAKYCDLKDARSIRDFLRGRTKSAGGFLWAWDNDTTTVIGPVEEKEERNIRYENY